jgi:hypothetical protein
VERLLRLHAAPTGPGHMARLRKMLNTEVKVLPQPDITIDCAECVSILVARHNPTIVEFGCLEPTVITRLIAGAGLKIPAYRYGEGAEICETQLVVSGMLSDPGPYTEPARFGHVFACGRSRQVRLPSSATRSDDQEEDWEGVFGLA